MKNEFAEVIVVGAGHAGLSVAFYLRQLKIGYIVFERGKVGESWKSQRWDSFCLNTSNKVNNLPGWVCEDQIADKFPTAAEFVSTLNSYVLANELNVKEQHRVTKVARNNTSGMFTVHVEHGGEIKEYRCRQVIICSGSQNEKKIPSFASNVSPRVRQFHASEYKNSSQLPDGAVLVVGSAQSGCQVAEDLLEAGRKVFLATSCVARMPRRYRGKDIVDWLINLGFFNLKTDQVTDKKMLHMPAPQVSGRGNKGHSISLQQLARQGATILGKIQLARGEYMSIDSHAADHVQFADEFSNKVKEMVDEHLLKTKQEIPIAEFDVADLPDPGSSCASLISSLNMLEAGIASIVWCTGFGMNMQYIDLPVFDEAGNPRHNEGVADFKGLYFLGLPWLRSRKSGIILGITEDASFIANKVHEYAQEFASLTKEPAIAKVG